MHTLRKIIFVAIAVWIAGSLVGSALLACKGVPARDLIEVIATFGFSSGVVAGFDSWTLILLRTLLIISAIGFATACISGFLAVVVFANRAVKLKGRG